MIPRRLTLAFTFVFLSGFGATAPLAQETNPVLPDVVESWLASPHADLSSESFRHWNEDGAVPPGCANCHTSSGFRDFLGADGSEAGVVDHPALTGSTVDCAACHNQTATALDQVTFPSGAITEGLGTSAVCWVCHQGRQSSVSVESALAGLDEDAVSPDLGFINVHYRAAAASLMGAAAHGGYEYPGKTYASRFTHVPGFDNCTGCHDPHTLAVSAEGCVACHKTAEIADIRTHTGDYDADGDAAEGAAHEIAGLHDALGRAIGAYAAEVAGAPVVYAPDSYPYFFADLNANGQPDGDEVGYPNRYQSWTPRLLKAAYNYQFVAKDPGIHAHNPAYAAQILIDSLESLGAKVETAIKPATRP
ncbi:polyheme membrane-associated cytochrome C [Defluviimonas sp. WL0024]|uniref:Polyheme membrane-associated cytochrome C n=1 Tax=Albidovulum salinarum TaxID=2984153 RepID=A0ABT2X0T7_9RHOB|nr:polyheme membrane-associated cytochrome C [Defluviimonas sp. WL0024]MCU9847546.1 polyheme membrane-associated cytochrome C [Defluviimonas sp. WL0024]